jgi:LEA14-like dessication related protein
MRRAWILSVLLGFLVACPSYQHRVNIRNCRFTLRHVTVTGVDLMGAHFRVTIGVHNPNEVETIVDRLDFDFFFNQKQVFHGQNRARLTVPAGETRDLNLDLTADYLDVASVAKDLRTRTFKDYRLKGKVMLDTIVGTFDFPVELSGQFQ